MPDELKSTYLNKNPLVRAFFKKKVNLAVGIADLKKEDSILDFGCGEGWLKNKLRAQGFNVTGYDITPEHSDIADYKKLKPSKIFAMDVFEHIEKSQINIEQFGKLKLKVKGGRAVFGSKVLKTDKEEINFL